MKRPVFVVGCPRSGTTLLYSMLVSAGGFAAYRKETYFYDLLPRFPDLTDPAVQHRFEREFLQGYLGKVPGLDVAPFVKSALAKCTDSCSFLPLFLGAIARAQQMDRWIEATPVHVLYLNEIQQAVPDALFVHVIRDGRDCALSNTSQGWVPTLPWDRSRRLGVAALFWESMVQTGRRFGRTNPGNYLELRFEDLIADPHTTLDRLGRFIDHNLDYDYIRRNPVHAVKRPNTSFQAERDQPDFNPVGRWKVHCAPADIQLCETLVGRSLEELGYHLAYPSQSKGFNVRARLMQAVYLSLFSTKHWLKAHTPLGRYVTNTSVWAEQPKVGEVPVLPVRNNPIHASERGELGMVNS
jgi:hypothetical protein